LKSGGLPDDKGAGNTQRWSQMSGHPHACFPKRIEYRMRMMRP
jgi:hypothetical protein